jgi:hypothetical protein
MLEVVNVPTSTGGVECWMDIQIGAYPKISPIPERIKIGETLSVLVYLKDPLNEYDIIVKDCYAYDHEDYSAKTTGRLQLSDNNGCSRKKKLFGGWTKTTQTGNSGATLVVHNTLYAFKFPDKAQVYLKCDIEICRNGCDAPVCGDAQLVSKKVERKKIATTTARPTVATSPLSRAPQRGNVIRTKTVVKEDATQRPRTRAPVTATATAFATAEILTFTTEKPRTRGTRPPTTPAETRAPRTRDPALRTRAPAVATQRVVSETTRGRGRGRGTTQAQTYLPPETTSRTQLCSNGADDSTYPDCCLNAGGKGKYCCTNGANNPSCELPTTTRATRPPTTRALPTTTKPKCSNGAPDSAFPDCCLNAGGKGKYCCTNGANNAECELPTTTRATRPPTTKLRPKCSNGAPDSAYPDCCLNAGGKGKYCCTNGANNQECEVPTRATRPPRTRPPTQAPTERPTRGPTRGRPTQASTYLPPETTTLGLRIVVEDSATQAPKCSNGAPDEAYPDCCLNVGGKGKYCCTNGANNPSCELPTTTRATRPPTTRPKPKCSNGAPDSAYPDCCVNAGGKGKYCCTNGANNPQCQLPTTTRATQPPTTTRPRPKCSNGAPDSAYPDCCLNAGGKGKYCCTNGANNPTCELATTTRATRPPTTRALPTTTKPRPKCSNGAPDSAYPDCCLNAGGKGKYCCTNGANNPSCEVPTTPQPTYLPPQTTRPVRLKIFKINLHSCLKCFYFSGSQS